LHMDSGPFSTPQPNERRAVSRPEPSYRPKDPQPAAAPEEPRTVRRAPVSRHDEPKRRLPRFILPVVIIILVIAIAAGGWWFWQRSQNSDSAINHSEYQAVFFTNGQVYFGKLNSFNSEYLKLTDIFYLQASSSSDSANPQQTTTDSQTNVQLIKLGDEIHGPQDEMVIARDQVLFYENLKPNGKVAQSIAKYNTQSH